jgi:hypothetical protein
MPQFSHFLNCACYNFFPKNIFSRVCKTKKKSKTCYLFVRWELPSLFIYVTAQTKEEMSALSLAYPMPALFHSSLGHLWRWKCSEGKENTVYVNQLAVHYITYRLLPQFSPICLTAVGRNKFSPYSELSVHKINGYSWIINTLRRKLIYITYKESMYRSQRTRRPSVRRASRWVLHREIIAVYLKYIQ